MKKMLLSLCIDYYAEYRVYLYVALCVYFCTLEFLTNA